MMSLMTYALVLVPCLVGGAAMLGMVMVRRSANRLDRRAARIAADAAPPRHPREYRPRAVRRAVER